MTRDELRSVLPGGKWHEVAMKWAADPAAVLQCWGISSQSWLDTKVPTFAIGKPYRIKPQVLRYRVALLIDDGFVGGWSITHARNEAEAAQIESRLAFDRWLGDWQEAEK